MISKEKYSKLKNEALLVYEVWGGLGEEAGVNSIIVDYNKNIIEYSSTYKHHKLEVKEHPISESQFMKIINFIEDNLVNKDYENIMMYDAGFTVYSFYNGKHYHIMNNVSFILKTDKAICNKVSDLLKSML